MPDFTRNRRVRRALAQPSSGADARFNWHLKQSFARQARHYDIGPIYGCVPSQIVAQPTNPLHVQWLSTTYTPWEYRHLVKRGRKPI